MLFVDFAYLAYISGLHAKFIQTLWKYFHPIFEYIIDICMVPIYLLLVGIAFL